MILKSPHTLASPRYFITSIKVKLIIAAIELERNSRVL